MSDFGFDRAQIKSEIVAKSRLIWANIISSIRHRPKTFPFVNRRRNGREEDADCGMWAMNS